VYKAQKSDLRKRIPAPLLYAGGAMLFLLLVSLFGVTLGSLIGPLMLTGFGLLLMVPAWRSTPKLQSRASFLAVPGAFFAMLGVMNFTASFLRHEQIWAYGWLLLPAAIIAGVMYMKRYDADSRIHAWGNSVLRVLVTLTLALGLFLELLVFRTFGPLWPFMVIGLGVYLFVKHQRSKA
jgi:hypothetical protein